jgi:hypothetical protein
LLTLRHYNGLHFNKLLLRSFGYRVAPTPDGNWALKSNLPNCKVAEKVEKICAVSVGDSVDRNFTWGALASRGGN